MTNDNDGWGSVPPNDLNINSLPTDWSGFTREAKVERQIEAVQYQIQKVRSGNFDMSKAPQVSALCLEGLMELSEFYADVESEAKNAKHMAEYIEGETATNLRKEKTDNGKKVSEAALKRLSSCASEVKEARTKMVTLEKEYKRWRYVYETLKEAHIFFRNIAKV